jgi:hypothetical protein
MPAPDIGVDKNAGVYEISIAPSAAPLRLYVAFRGLVYQSDDRGSHWARTAFVNVAMDAPQNGAFVTTDGGATWSPVSYIPKSQPAKKWANSQDNQASFLIEARGYSEKDTNRLCL